MKSVKFKWKEDKKIYMILDLNVFTAQHLQKLDSLLSKKVCAVQIWDNQKDYKGIEELLRQIVAICHRKQVVVIMNNRVDLLQQIQFDGIHFDEIPQNWDSHKNLLVDKIVGITCTNSIEIVKWAEKEKVDYISFCSLFPSVNNSKCELVNRQFLAEIQKMLTIPFFVAGGITPSNIAELQDIHYQGIALVSDLMKKDNAKSLLDEYYNNINLTYEDFDDK